MWPALLIPRGVGRAQEGAGDINRGEGASHVQKAMGPRGVNVVSHNVAGIVDPMGLGKDGAGHHGSPWRPGSFPQCGRHR